MSNNSKHLLPVGTIIAFGLPEANIPPGWLLCNGQKIDEIKYPELSHLMDTVPDLRGRTLLGSNPDDNKYVLDKAGGSETGVLTKDNLPKHRHAISDSFTSQMQFFIMYNQNVKCGKPYGLHKGGLWGNAVSATDPINNSTGEGDECDSTPFTIMQPYYVINYIIFTGG